MPMPDALYQFMTMIARYLPMLRPAQQRGLAWWVWGTILAKSACQSAVVLALSLYARPHALRQRLREWLYDGTDKAAPCQQQVAVPPCFAGLLRWVLAWWQTDTLALALDATLDRTRHAALVLSVLYRGTAIPVAWHILPANTPGAWAPHLVALFTHVAGIIPPRMTVLVLADRGLWSPKLWDAIRAQGWHPLLRVALGTIFETPGAYRAVRTRLPGPGHVWIGCGRRGCRKARRLAGTMIVIWAPDQAEPWALLTDLPPQAVGVAWYALRMWIECGFRVLKRMGWQWEHTRRSDPARVARYWLVLAVATLWTVATGTRAEDADQQQCAPSRLRRPVNPPAGRTRTVSVVHRGLIWLQHLARGRLWTQLWLWPDPWPEPPAGLQWVMEL